MSSFKINTFNVANTIVRQQATIQEEHLHASQSLASGERIRSAADDASGLTISEGLSSRFRSLGSAIQNIQDGVSLTQVMDSELQQITSMVQRMRELSVRAANETFNDQAVETTETEPGEFTTTINDDRYSMEEEFQTLKEEIDRRISNASFNGIPLLTHGFDPDLLGEPLLSQRPDLTDGQSLTERSLASNSAFQHWDDDRELPNDWKWPDATDPDDPSDIPVSREEEDRLFGDYSMRIEEPTTTFDPRHVLSQEFGIDPLPAGETREYRVGLWAKVEDVNGKEPLPEIRIDPKWGDGGTTAIGGDPSSVEKQFTAEGEWQYFEAEFESQQGVDTAAVDFRFRDPSAEIDTSVVPNQVEESRDILVDGTFMVPTHSELSLQIGPDEGNDFEISTDDFPNLNTNGLGIRNSSVRNADRAAEAIQATSEALRTLSRRRSRVGAMQNRLNRSARAQQVEQFELQKAESRIRDANMAEMTARRARTQIQLDMSSSMLAQVGATAEFAVGLIESGDPPTDQSGSTGPDQSSPGGAFTEESSQAEVAF